jgi:hypothetical protein
MKTLKAFPSKTLREKGQGGLRAIPPCVEAASKPKAKKGYIDTDYHGFFIENGLIRKFTTCRGVRYVHPQPIVVRKCLTTIGGGQP